MANETCLVVDGLIGDLVLSGEVLVRTGSLLDGEILLPSLGSTMTADPPDLKNSAVSEYESLASPSVSILLMMERSSLSDAKCPYCLKKVPKL